MIEILALPNWRKNAPGGQIMKHHLLILGCCSTLLAAPVLAQTVEEQQTTVVKEHHGGTAKGAVAGAVAGAVVAGPVGLVVGGVAGAVVGHSVAPPTEVRTYVTTQEVAPVSYGRPIEVGHPVDGDVTWREIPAYPRYHWAYLDGHRVVIDSETHNVVEVY
jgi:hypothetical protein